MKPFNIEEAKAGKPVVTRDGKDVVILKFDLKGEYPVVGYWRYTDNDEENVETWTIDGKVATGCPDCQQDLFMKKVVKEHWFVTVYDKLNFGWFTKEYKTQAEAEAKAKLYHPSLTKAFVHKQEFEM